MPRWGGIGRSYAGFFKALNKTGQPREILDGILPTIQVDRHWPSPKIDVYGLFAQAIVPTRAKPAAAPSTPITNLTQVGPDARINSGGVAHGLVVGDWVFVSGSVDAGLNTGDPTGAGGGVWPVTNLFGAFQFDVGPIVLGVVGAGGLWTGNPIATVEVNAARELWIWGLEATVEAGAGSRPVTLYRQLQDYFPTIALPQGPAQALASAWLQPEGDLNLGPLSAVTGAQLFQQTATVLGVPTLTTGPVLFPGDPFGVARDSGSFWRTGDAPPIRLEADARLVLQAIDPTRSAQSLNVNVYASEVYRAQGRTG